MRKSSELQGDENGATAIEYAAIAAFISIAAIVAFALLGQSVNTSYTNTATQSTNAMR